MKSEKLCIELGPYYRTLLDSVRLLIHILRPDLGPPTQSQCVQFLLGAFPVEPLLVQAIMDREKLLKENVSDELGEPAIPTIVEPDHASIWRASLRKLESASPAAGQRRRRRTRPKSVGRRET